MDATRGKIIVDGNAAARWARIFAGVTVVTWYPITPSSSLVETLIGYLQQYRRGADGKATFAVVQAEDELAAIGMVIGAGWAGARAMTATSGPGVSLMSEFAGLGYYAEIPAVIFDVQRVGPSTGLPTRTAQGDVLSTALPLPRRHPARRCSCPARWRSASRMAVEAFDLAERLQTPVFVLTDLDLGMNNWMAEPFPYPDRPHRPRQGARRRRTWSGWAASPATRTWTATASAGARCPAPTTRGPPTSPAAPATTRRPPTASARTSSSGTWTGWPASSTGPARAPAAARWSRRPGAPGRDHRLRLLRPGHRARAGTSCRDEARARDRLPARPRLALRRARCATSWPPTTGSTWWSRTATAQLPPLLKLDLAAGAG